MRPGTEGCPQWSPWDKEGQVPECLSCTYHVQNTSHVLSSLEAQSPNPKKVGLPDGTTQTILMLRKVFLMPTLYQTLSWAVRANTEKNDTKILIWKVFRVNSSLSFPIPASTPWLLHTHPFLPSQPPTFYWLMCL